MQLGRGHVRTAGEEALEQPHEGLFRIVRLREHAAQLNDGREEARRQVSILIALAQDDAIRRLEETDPVLKRTRDVHPYVHSAVVAHPRDDRLLP